MAAAPLSGSAAGRKCPTQSACEQPAVAGAMGQTCWVACNGSCTACLPVWWSLVCPAPALPALPSLNPEPPPLRQSRPRPLSAPCRPAILINPESENEMGRQTYEQAGGAQGWPACWQSGRSASRQAGCPASWHTLPLWQPPDTRPHLAPCCRLALLSAAPPTLRPVLNLHCGCRC